MTADVKTATIRITDLTVEEEPLYAEFVRRASFPVYPSLAFRDFLADAVAGEPVYLVAWRGNEPCGVLPSFFRWRARFGTIANSLPWYGSHGGCWLLDDSDEHARRALLRAFRRRADERSCLSATVVLPLQEASQVETYAAELDTAVRDERVGQVTRLPEDGPDLESRLLATFRGKTRNLVRKALRQGFEEWCGDEDWAWHVLHELHTENLLAIGGRAKPWDHFAALRRHIPAHARRLAIARHEGEPVAALLLLMGGDTIEYLTPAIRKEQRARQPLSFLILRGMMEAVEKGHAWWNWGGTWTSQRSLHHFKAGFGARDQPYSYVVRAGDGLPPTLGALREHLPDIFPYYYVYPFHRPEPTGVQGRW